MSENNSSRTFIDLLRGRDGLPGRDGVRSPTGPPAGLPGKDGVRSYRTSWTTRKGGTCWT